MEDILQKKLDRLINLIENSMIIDLALKGIPHQAIRRVIGGDIHRVTSLLRPIKKEIKKLLQK